MISLVIPAYNEDGSIETLYAEITAAVSELNLEYEIIFVNDGSKDRTQEVIDELYKTDPRHIKIIEFRSNFGKAAALRAGFEMAKGDIIAQLDADLQDNPKELTKFIQKINEGYDMVVGWKQNRKDSFIKNKTSKLFNGATNFISKAKLHDHNCGFKVYKSEVIRNVNLYGELHRYIAVLASAKGYKVAEVPIEHRKRQFDKSKYGASRFIKGFLDLLTVVFITKFQSRPLHFFGYIGLSFFSLGFVFATYLTLLKLITHQSIGERPLLLFSVMLMIMGVQILVTGIVGEQITTLVYKGNGDYIIKKKVE